MLRARACFCRARETCYRLPDVLVYAVVDDALSPDFPLGDSLEVFIRREDAERFVEEVRGDDPEAAAKLRIEERELEADRAELARGAPPLAQAAFASRRNFASFSGVRLNFDNSSRDCESRKSFCDSRNSFYRS